MNIEIVKGTFSNSTKKHFVVVVDGAIVQRTNGMNPHTKQNRLFRTLSGAEKFAQSIKEPTNSEARK